MPFRFPTASDRVAVIGATGTGKTTAGFWLLSHARFDKRPWVIVDYKREELVDKIGFPPVRELKLGKLPKKRGLYVVYIKPGQQDAVEDWLWRIWEKGNIGLFVDEAALMPDKEAFKACLRQGRSKRIPVISCMQRPVDVQREALSEATFFQIFRIQDVKRDMPIIEGFVRDRDHKLRKDLPERHSWWYDVAQNLLIPLKPVPKPDQIVTDLRRDVPFSYSIFG